MAPNPAELLLQRAAGANARDDHRIAVAIDDLFLPEADRLDERLRARSWRILAHAVSDIERALLAFAQRRTGSSLRGGSLDRLTRAGLLRDHMLMTHFLSSAMLDLAAEQLDEGVARDDRSDLLMRLCACGDGVVASAAGALLSAINRGRAGVAADLPSALHERLVWWVAAALHEAGGDEPDQSAALTEAALRSLAAHDEDGRTDVLAARLAAAIDARADELPDLLADSLADARPVLFVAVLARAAKLRTAEASTITLDRDGERLWLTLRALDLDRTAIARIAVLLAAADPRRDLDAFADTIDLMAAIGRDTAAAAIAPMRLHPDFRAAQRSLAQAARP